MERWGIDVSSHSGNRGGSHLEFHSLGKHELGFQKVLTRFISLRRGRKVTHIVVLNNDSNMYSQHGWNALTSSGQTSAAADWAVRSFTLSNVVPWMEQMFFPDWGGMWLLRERKIGFVGRIEAAYSQVDGLQDGWEREEIRGRCLAPSAAPLDCILTMFSFCTTRFRSWRTLQSLPHPAAEAALFSYGLKVLGDSPNSVQDPGISPELSNSISIWSHHLFTIFFIPSGKILA